ncbi:MAG: SDR family oxidoreductase [Cyanobacteria bacterium J06648_11]
MRRVVRGITDMTRSLEGKVVLVTGASSGIGEAIALEVAAQKAKVVLAARREGVLNTVADLVSKRGGTPLVVPTDMTDSQQVETLAAKAIDAFGAVDVLVNNAGYGQMGPIEEVNEAAVRQQFDVNVFGLLTLTRAVVPGMRDRREGRIINLSSVAGRISMPFMGIYNASKFAVEALSDALRVELAPFGIQTIVIQPGPVETEFFRIAEQEAAAAVDLETSPYAEALERMAETMDTSSMAWTAERTAKLIVKAMTEDNPSDRYAAFNGGKMMLGLFESIPTGLSDRLYANAFGLDRL